MASLETEPLIRLQSHLRDGLEIEEQQLYYVEQRRDDGRGAFVEEIPSDWTHFPLGKFIVLLLFM
jgi:hypothetical protein